MVAREAALAALAVAVVTVVCEAAGVGAVLSPHPAWLAVLVLSARYGSRGLALALPAVWLTLALASLFAGHGVGPMLGATSVSELAALLGCVFVAWIATGHERHAGELSRRLGEVEGRGAREASAIAELRDAAVALRARADRMDHSVTFLREIAERLESGDPVASAQASLELAMARTGARAGVVQLVERRRLRTVVCSGVWSLENPTPPDLQRDNTAYAALEQAKAVRAIDLPNAVPDDSDLAAPICDDRGTLFGIVALRGVPADSLRPALVHDLALIARWCSKSMAAARIESRLALLEEAPAAEVVAPEDVASSVSLARRNN